MRAFLLAAALGVTSLGASQARPSPAALAGQVQAHYQTVRDFTADFTQTYRGLLRTKGETERGEIKIKKPSRLRFTYTSPQRKEFVADGSQFYSYFARDKQGSVTPLPKEGEASTAFLFLAGRGHLVRDFVASMDEVQPDGEWHLTLTPKTKQSDFATLTLMVDRRTLALRGFETVDDQGTSTFRFTNYRENRGIGESTFVFRFPAGTEIRR